MKVKVEYKLSQAGQKAAIRSGINASQNQLALLDDPDNRLLDTTIGSINSDGVMVIDVNHRPAFNCQYGNSSQWNYTIADVRNKIASDYPYFARREDTVLITAKETGSTRYLDSPIVTIEDIVALEKDIIDAMSLLKGAESALNDEIAAARIAWKEEKEKEEAEKHAARIAWKEEKEKEEAEKHAAKASEESPDPFAPYLHLDGLALFLKYNRQKEATSCVLDFLEAELLADLTAHAYETFDPDEHFVEEEYEWDDLSSYTKIIPLAALKALETARELYPKASAVVYYPKNHPDPVLCLHVDFKFCDTWRTIVVHLYKWE